MSAELDRLLFQLRDWRERGVRAGPDYELIVAPVTLDLLIAALEDARRYRALHEAVGRDEIVTLWHDEFGWVARHITADETYQYSRPDLRAAVDAMIASLAAKETP